MNNVKAPENVQLKLLPLLARFILERWNEKKSIYGEAQGLTILSRLKVTKEEGFCIADDSKYVFLTPNSNPI